MVPARLVVSIINTMRGLEHSLLGMVGSYNSLKADVEEALESVGDTSDHLAQVGVELDGVDLALTNLHRELGELAQKHGIKIPGTNTGEIVPESGGGKPGP